MKTPSREPSTELGRRLRELRLGRRLSQRELAKRAGLSPTAVSQIESGDRPTPAAETVAALEMGLGEPPVSLLHAATRTATLDEAIAHFRTSRLGKFLEVNDREVEQLKLAVRVLNEAQPIPLLWASLLQGVRMSRDPLALTALVTTGVSLDLTDVKQWFDLEAGDIADAMNDVSRLIAAGREMKDPASRAAQAQEIALAARSLIPRLKWAVAHFAGAGDTEYAEKFARVVMDLNGLTSALLEPKPASVSTAQRRRKKKPPPM